MLALCGRRARAAKRRRATDRQGARLAEACAVYDPSLVARPPIPTWYFALVVVRLGRRFLLVKERRHGERWYLPAGRVEPGERITEAARREALEETGVPVVLEGILRIEHTPIKDGTARCRMIFVARPETDAQPKSVPDRESLAASWFT